MAKLPAKYSVDAPHHRLRRKFQELTKFQTQKGVDELNELATNPDLLWAHYVMGIDPLTRKIVDTRFEDTPGLMNPLSHWGSRKAARDRYEWISPRTQLEPPVPDAPERTLMANFDISNPLWVNDNGLRDPSNHIVGGLNHPFNESGRVAQMLKDEGIEVQPQKVGDKLITQDPRIITENPESAKNVEDILQRHGFDSILYRNIQEDPGSITAVPLGENRIFAPDGRRIRQAAGTAGAAGLLTAAAPEQAVAEMDPDAELAKLQMAHTLITGQGPEEEDYTNELLRQATEEAYKETRPSLRMKALIEILAYRQRLNHDIQTKPGKSLASIPVGAAEEVWKTANMLGEGWSALNHFIDQNDEPTKIDHLLDYSTSKQEQLSDFITDELGLPQSVRTMGGITGAGGLATKGAKKGAETLYDLYRLGL